jgi:4,5-DOPA dioxygenase extradiol
MKRNEFLMLISWLPLTTTAMSLSELNKLTSTLEASDIMPVLFVGHGSPMNGIENNEFSHSWELLAKQIQVPKAVICISAHWYTKGTKITAMNHPKTIHDFGGFPKELFEVQYPAPGNSILATEASKLIKKTTVGLDHEWGLDHGTWSVVKRMYPHANIPILQLSIDYTKPASYHYELAKELYSLRQKGVLFIGSGNMVHNLGMVAWDKLNDPEYGYDWAHEINATFKKHILNNNHQALIDYEKLGKSALLAIPTPEHYLPLIYTLGLTTIKDKPTLFNDKAIGGSLTMTSVKYC